MSIFAWTKCKVPLSLVLILLLGSAVSAAASEGISKVELPSGPLEFTGKANPRRFINAIGEESGLFGFENGRLEGWIYPLKIFHDFHLAFQLEGDPRIYSADDLASAIRVLPQMVQLQYSAEAFTVRETLFAPRHQPGLVILLDVHAPAAMRIFVRFRPDLNLMWPAAIGGQAYEWDAKHKWIRLSEPTNRFSALVGSPMAVASNQTGYSPYLSNQQPYGIMELHVTPEEAKRYYVPILVAAGISNLYDAEATYEKMLGGFAGLYQESLQHYLALDKQGPQYTTPDAKINESLRWSRVALDQLNVCNPFLGCSFVSGYGSSGTGNRPMYDWFFEEPTSTASAYLDGGEAGSLKEALQFLQKYQRTDGKMPHEISQSASLIDWFKQYPYAYIHPDSTLWYLIAMADYYDFTGDADFVRKSWGSIRQAYHYACSTLDPSDGLPKLRPGEWGSMEVSGFAKDTAMAAEWIVALRAVEDLSGVPGNAALASESKERREETAASMEREFWNPQLDYYNYGVSGSGEPVTYLNSAIGYSAWLGGLPENHVQAVLERLSTAAFLSDWGERNMSLADPRYEEGSYHVGSVWPFLTAGPMLAQFKYHDAVQAYSTWKEMLELRNLDERGALPEVLSGTFFRLLDEAVPHQMFSELTGIPGLVEGVLGIQLNVPDNSLQWSPHLPPSWPGVSVRQFPFGAAELGLELSRTEGQMVALLSSSAEKPIKLRFSPALPAGSRIVSVHQDGRPVRFEVSDHGSDLHAVIETEFSGKTRLQIRYEPGVAVEVELMPLLEGDESRNLRVLRTGYQTGQFTMLVEGRPDEIYHVLVYTPWGLTPTEGATLEKGPQTPQVLDVVAPEKLSGETDRAGYAHWTVRVTVAEGGSKASKRSVKVTATGHQ